MTADFIEQELRWLEEEERYRTLRWLEEGPSPWVRMGEKKVLLLCSNDYLGLANHPQLKEAAIHAVEAWGCGSGGSRSICGSLTLHQRLEERLAQFHGTEAALLFNSGYSANLSILQALMGEGDEIFSDELNHASLVDGCRLSKAAVRIYSHRDTVRLENLLSKSRARKKLIVTDGVFSMDGDCSPP
jgi:7-keto-8-aminopelargonate synthetase-like enzyme